MMFLNKLFIKFLSLFLVINFTFVSSLKAETVFVDSFSVAAQDDFPEAIAFNTDGTKMFVVGAIGDDVNEYTLSTGFDVSTASFVDSFSVAGQETGAHDLAFNTDGTKMFVVGVSGVDVNEYTLSTGFDVSTASFVDSFSVAGQETSPLGLAFNTDGTKMFVVGRDDDNVNEYTLSTGFDVSTASFVDSFSVAGQDSFPEAIAFNTDGTKMFVAGSIGDDVNEYTLSAGFDLIGGPDPTTNKDLIGLIDAQVQGAKLLAKQTTNTILDRISHVRSQDPMDETSQQDINVSFTNPDLTLASNLVTMPKMPNLNPFQVFQTEEWSTWTKADITIGKIGDTSLSSVKDISIQGVSIGADRKMDDDKMYGLSMRFANDDTDIGNTGTNISTQSINLSVYGSHYLDNDTFVDGVIGAGYMQSDVVRKNGSHTLNGDREGNQIFGSLKFGKKIKQSQFNIAPYGKIHSSYTHLKGYRETGTSALKFDALEIGAISNSVGLEIDRSIQYQKSSVKPRFIIEYGKEIGSDESTQDMYYGDDTFTKYSYTSDQKDRDVMTTGIGFDFVHDNGLTLSTDYERKQNGDNDYFDSVFIAANFLSRKESQ
ncbi:MAG: autotransporter domain-containing protein, partial [Alphaproteobacteria bacterium]